MKNLKTSLIFVALSFMTLASCGGSPTPSSEVPSSIPPASSSEPAPSSELPSSETPSKRNKVTSDTLYVKQVENMPDDFIIGMDSSSVLSLEESGVKYYDFNGEEQDLFKILAGVGITHIRIRIWNDPWTADHKGYGGGNVDIDRAVIIGKRATAQGLKVLANFHYSDFWADPGRQLAPKAWKGKTLEEKEVLLYDYTLECMNKFKAENVDVDIVQVGNESNSGIAGENTEEGMEKYSRLVTQGSRAVKEVYPDARIAVHFADPQKGTYSRTAAQLRRYGCEYDIFGSSYYPFYHGTIENFQATMNNIAKSYDKDVMVLETSYAYVDQDFDDGGKQFPGSGLPEYYPITQSGQANNFRNLCDVMVNGIENNRGIGVVYWEGTWIAVPGNDWASRKVLWEEYGSGWACDRAGEYDPNVAAYGGGGTQVDNQCFFNSNGRPLESLKVFGMMYDGNVVDEYIDGAEDITLIKKTNDTFSLPETVPGIYNSDRREEVPVTWEEVDLEELKRQGPGTHQIKGVAGGTFNVTCYLVLKGENLIEDGDFEINDPSKSPWTITNKSDTPLSATYWAKVAKENAMKDGGTYSLGWWGQEQGVVKFEARQTFTVTEDDTTYKLQAYIMVGQKSSDVIPSAKQNNYVSILVNGVETYHLQLVGTNYDGGFIDFTLTNIELHASDTNEIIVHVEADVLGYWGAVDALSLGRR